MVQLPPDLNILEFKGTIYTVVQNWSKSMSDLNMDYHSKGKV